MKTQILTALLLSAGIGCENAADSYLYYPDYSYPNPMTEPQTELRLELVGEYGESEDGLVFGQIADLAVSESGRLAVADPMSCLVWIIRIQADSWDTLGRCGDGPGEFRSPVAVAFLGDTLFVFDSQRMTVSRLAPGGEELSRMRLDLPSLGAMGVSDLFVDPSVGIVAGLHLLPNGLGSEHHQLVVFDAEDGKIVSRGLTVPRLAQSTRRQMIRYGALCGRVGSDGLPMVVTANTWAPQVVGIRGNSFEELFSIKLPIEWAIAREDPDRPGEWRNMAPLPSIECGEDYIVVSYRRQARSEDGRTRISSAVLVVLDRMGRTRAVIEEAYPPEVSQALLMIPEASIGDRVFFLANGLREYPVVREYRLVRDGRPT